MEAMTLWLFGNGSGHVADLEEARILCERALASFEESIATDCGPGDPPYHRRAEDTARCGCARCLTRV